MVLTQRYIHIQKNEVVSISHTMYITKVGAKWIIDPNVRAKTINLVEENIDRHSCLGWTPKAKVMKEKIDKLS